MQRKCHSVFAKGTAIFLLVLIAGAVGVGCSRFREHFARRTPPPAPAEAKPVQQNADAHYRLGRLYQDRSRHRDAASEFRKVLAVAADSIKALNALGVSLDALGQYSDAAIVYTKALELDPSLDYVHNNLGYSYLLSGDRAAAAAAFTKALELNPGNIVARNNLSRIQGSTEQVVPAMITAPEPTAPAPSREVVAAPQPPAPATEVEVPSSPSALTAIDVQKQADGLVVTLQGNGPLKHEYFLFEGRSMVVDIIGVSNKVKPNMMKVGDPWVSQIRIGDHDKPKQFIRVVFDLKKVVEYSVNRFDNRIVVAFGAPALAATGAVPEMTAASADAPETAAPAPAEFAASASAPAAAPLPVSTPVAAPDPVPAPAAVAAPKIAATPVVAAPAPVVAPVPVAAPAPVVARAPARATVAAPTPNPSARTAVQAKKDPVMLLVPVAGGSVGNADNPGSVLLRRVSSAELRRETAMEISNGSHKAELLADIVAFLVAEGYRVEIGPLEQSRERTMILYRDGALQSAWQVAKIFPGYQEMKKTGTFTSPNASVRVLLGRDMVAQQERFAVIQRERLAGTAAR